MSDLPGINFKQVDAGLKLVLRIFSAPPDGKVSKKGKPLFIILELDESLMLRNSYSKTFIELLNSQT